MANEKRLISADVAKEMIVNHANEFSDMLNRREKALLIGGGTSCIDKCPTVDAVEVVHGRWLYDSGSGKYFCSACDENALSFRKDTLYGGDLYEVCLTDYCPNCGAKMDGGNEDGNL